MYNDYRLNLASMLAESSPQQAIDALCEVIAELQDKLYPEKTRERPCRI